MEKKKRKKRKVSKHAFRKKEKDLKKCTKQTEKGRVFVHYNDFCVLTKQDFYANLIPVRTFAKHICR